LDQVHLAAPGAKTPEERHMSSQDQPGPPEGPKPRVAGAVMNHGKPIMIKKVELAGVSAEAGNKGQTIKVWTKLVLDSDVPMFHRVASNLAGVLEQMAQEAGSPVRIGRAETVLLVVRKDDTAELWVDAAAVSLRCMVKRAVAAGTAIFSTDIVDVTGMSFPGVTIGPTDRVLCLFRQDWRFALYFHLDRNRELDVEEFITTLGTLHRNLSYRHLYDALADDSVASKLAEAGWFPFAEIITSDFGNLLACIQSGIDLADAEDAIVKTFNKDRLGRLYERWTAKPHFASRAKLLKPALDAFSAQEPVAAIKILLTEIEGILQEAYRSAHGKPAKLKDLLAFASKSGERRAGTPDSLLLSSAFGHYLSNHTFANFDPQSLAGKENSRHAVGHGAASEDTYTMTRALQVILTVDQLAFFT
jgi:hypothetical protein